MTLDRQAVTPARPSIPVEQRWWEKKPVTAAGSAVAGSAAAGSAMAGSAAAGSAMAGSASRVPWPTARHRGLGPRRRAQAENGEDCGASPAAISCHHWSAPLGLAGTGPMPQLSQTMAPPGATIWWSGPGSAPAQARPGPVPYGSVPPGPVPYGSAPPGPVPYASAPPGAGPHGSVPPGPVPYASAPPGAGPHGSVPRAPVPLRHWRRSGLGCAQAGAIRVIAARVGQEAAAGTGRRGDRAGPRDPAPAHRRRRPRGHHRDRRSGRRRLGHVAARHRDRDQAARPDVTSPT